MSIARRFTSIEPTRAEKQSAPVRHDSSDAPVVRPKNKGGRPKSPTSTESLKPWVKEGVSRNTWYARRREKRLFEEGRQAGLAEKE